MPAAALGLEDAAWRDVSLALRRDHEAAHYLTRRLLGSMRNHLHDELIADYAGMTGATGAFRADWFRAFLGLGEADGRLRLYRGDPPLPDDDLARAAELVDRCAEQVEAFDRARGGGRSWRDRVGAVLALASVGLEEIGRRDGAARLAEACRRAEAAVRWEARAG
ncbi:MAG TPA: hypothetical protein VHM02_14195 [Thermoanaerobaculia bacterium]|nr:hypothetical protein [Thermoanaerobaculia bacterium]